MGSREDLDIREKTKMVEGGDSSLDNAFAKEYDIFDFEKLFSQRVKREPSSSLFALKIRSLIFIFELLTTTRARHSKSFILCLCMKPSRAKQANVHFAHIVHHDQLGIIAKKKNLTRSSILVSRFRCSSRRSSLNFLICLRHEPVSYFISEWCTVLRKIPDPPVTEDPT